ncbi:MAG: ATPase, T2SS/T4P/T4SS family, partial [Candidatus Saccharimonadales bacterium]
MNNQVDEKVESGVRQIIERAVKSGAEAVHIEPRANFVVVRFRCGGLLSVANKLPKSSAKQLSRHLKNLAGLKVSKTKMPQEASFSMKIGRQNYSLRLATLPIVDGEKLTINIQPEVAKRSPSLEDLGLWGDGLRALDHALAAPHGLVLLGSIQASYAAPTLTAMLDAFGPLASKLFFSETAAAAGEGIRPVVLNQEFGLDLSHHFKRLNQPDFSVIAAEVRGAKSAAAAAKLGAKADHLLIASLPAGSAVAAFNFWHRAVNNPALILNVRASIAQVFVRGLCPDCCETYQLDGLDQKNLAKCFDINSPAAVKRIHVLEKSAAAKLNSKLPLSSSENRIHQLWR